MAYNNIGSVIKGLREKKGISQQELALGICSLKQLYRIEKMISIPSAFLIQQLSYKLGENISSYLIMSHCDDPIYVVDYIKKIETHYLKREFDKVLVSIDNFNKSYFKFNDIKQLVLWYKGVALSNLGDKKITAMYFSDLLNLSTNTDIESLCTSFMKETEIRIVHSIISYYCKEGLFDQAKKLLIPFIENIENHYHNNNTSIHAQLLYNLSKLYYVQHDYKMSNKIADKGIKLCIKENFLPILADFYYMKGQCCEITSNFNSSVKYYNYFITLYDIQGHNKFSLKCKDEIISKIKGE